MDSVFFVLLLSSCWVLGFVFWWVVLVSSIWFDDLSSVFLHNIGTELGCVNWGLGCVNGIWIDIVWGLLGAGLCWMVKAVSMSVWFFVALYRGWVYLRWKGAAGSYGCCKGINAGCNMSFGRPFVVWNTGFCWLLSYSWGGIIMGWLRGMLGTHGGALVGIGWPQRGYGSTKDMHGGWFQEAVLGWFCLRPAQVAKQPARGALRASYLTLKPALVVLQPAAVLLGCHCMVVLAGVMYNRLMLKGDLRMDWLCLAVGCVWFSGFGLAPCSLGWFSFDSSPAFVGYWMPGCRLCLLLCGHYMSMCGPNNLSLDGPSFNWHLDTSWLILGLLLGFVMGFCTLSIMGCLLHLVGPLGSCFDPCLGSCFGPYMHWPLGSQMGNFEDQVFMLGSWATVFDLVFCWAVAAPLSWQTTALGPLFGQDMGFIPASYSLYVMGSPLYMGMSLMGWTLVPLPWFWVVVGYLNLWAMFIVLGLSSCRPKVFLYSMYCSSPSGLGVFLLAFLRLSDKCYSGGYAPWSSCNSLVVWYTFFRAKALYPKKKKRKH
ncbi:hypothetical protein R6Q59_009293 [Mikania micrantha]